MIKEEGMRALWIGVIITCLTPVVRSEELRFEANFDEARWEVLESPVACGLRHVVPGFGVFKFSNPGGYPERLSLSVLHHPLRANQEVQLSFQSPSWRQGASLGPPWVLKTHADAELKFSPVQVRAILENLNQGSLPCLTYRDLSRSATQIRVQLSSVRFEEAYQRYSRCQAELPKASFWQVAKSAVYFESGSAMLTDDAKTWLAYAAAYASQAEVTEVRLEAYTDRKGSHEANYELSKLRNDTVKRYLLEHNVPADKIKTSAKAEKNPLGDNRSQAGRAHNRRVSLRLLH